MEYLQRPKNTASLVSFCTLPVRVTGLVQCGKLLHGHVHGSDCLVVSEYTLLSHALFLPADGIIGGHYNSRVSTKLLRALVLGDPCISISGRTGFGTEHLGIRPPPSPANIQTCSRSKARESANESDSREERNCSGRYYPRNHTQD